jgi:vacuolar-type H+-ATPase subunit I/STV1
MMNTQNPYDPDERIEEPEEDHFAQNQYSWEREKPSGFFSNLLKKPEMPFGFIGLLLLLLILLFVVFIPGSRREGTDKQIAALEARLKQLEERTAKIEGIDEKVTQIWENAKEFEQFKYRYDRSEASISLRMDHIANEVSELKSKISVAKPTKTAATKTGDAAAKKSPTTSYHQVRSGETLYSISRRYGMQVDELRRLNQLGAQDAIYPGQKLKVEP